MIEIVGGVVDNFKNVSLVDGFSAIEAEGKGVLGFLMLDVVEKTFLAGAMPTAGDRSLHHRFLGADRAFVADFGLYLLQNVSAEFVGNVLLSRIGVGGESLNEFLEVHVISQAIGYVRSRGCFFLFCGDGFVPGKNWMAARLAETENLGKYGGVRFQESTGLHGGVKGAFGPVVDVVVHLSFLLGELDFFNFNEPRGRGTRASPSGVFMSLVRRRTRGSSTVCTTSSARMKSFDSNGTVMKVFQNEKLDQGSTRRKCTRLKRSSRRLTIGVPVRTQRCSAPIS